MKKKETINYVNNAELREVVKAYNQNNIYDDGKWIPKWKSRVLTIFKNGNLKGGVEEFNKKMDFISRREAHINELRARFDAMTSDEQRQFIEDLDKVRENLCTMVMKMVKGRAVCFKYYNRSSNIEFKNDVLQNAFVEVLTRINRFDEEKNTSTFAYVTQIITNSIYHDLKMNKKDNDTLISGLDFFENLNTKDGFQDLDSMNNYED